jgi:hypothetical protein
MGKIITLRSTFTAVGLAAGYAAGDEVSNHATAGSVVLPTFNLAGFTRGFILGAALDLTPASGDVVTTGADFELLVFKTDSAPAAAGDSAALSIAAATRALAVGSFRFDDGGWTGPLGTVAAGASQYQKVPATVVMPLATPALQSVYVGYPFEFKQGETETLTANLRALATWDPGGAGTIAQVFGITLDILIQD